MNLFQNKFRIETTRLDCWDYSKYGYYFVTICTKGKGSFFGEVFDEKVVLNKIGEKIKQIWLQILKHFEGIE